MSPCASKTISLSSSLEKQGIVSILEIPSNASAASLRRTLSADMSSKKWLSQNGFCPMNKIESHASVPDPLGVLSDEDNGGYYDEEGKEVKGSRSGFDIWAEIQEEKNKKKKEAEPRGQFDLWSSILSQKKGDSLNEPLPPPYVHPLVKQSSSSLTKKSLEICTESLGSETGSDGFSSYPPSESGDVEEDKEECSEIQEVKETYPEPEFKAPKYNYLCGKKLPARSFPPAIPSLSVQDGKSLHMRTRRDNGRLVLEAVSTTSQNNFHAQRQDGRLVLTFAKRNFDDTEEEKEERVEEREVGRELEELMEDFESFLREKEMERDDDDETNEEEEDEENEEMSFEMDEEAPAALKYLNGLTSVHRLAHLFNKPVRMTYRNPIWPNRKDKDENGETDDMPGVDKAETATQLAQSLPPRPPVGRLVPSPHSTVDDTVTATSNAYECYWRPKKTVMKSPTQNPKAQNQKHNKHGGGGGGDMVVSWLKGCKEQRRSLLFLEPFCIAT